MERYVLGAMRRQLDEQEKPIRIGAGSIAEKLAGDALVRCRIDRDNRLQLHLGCVRCPGDLRQRNFNNFFAAIDVQWIGQAQLLRQCMWLNPCECRQETHRASRDDLPQTQDGP